MSDVCKSESSGKATFKKLRCPFDLDTIFQVQFNVQGLKNVLEFIFEHLSTQDEKFVQQAVTSVYNELLGPVLSKSDKISSNNKNLWMSSLKLWLILLTQQIYKLSSIYQLTYVRNFQVQTVVDHKEIDAINFQLEQLKFKFESKINAPPLIDMDLLKETFALKGKPDNTMRRIEKLEKAQNEVQNKISDKQGDSIKDLNKRFMKIEDLLLKNHEERLTSIETSISQIKSGEDFLEAGEDVPQNEKQKTKMQKLIEELDSKVCQADFEKQVKFQVKQIDSVKSEVIALQDTTQTEFTQVKQNFDNFRQTQFSPYTVSVQTAEKKIALISEKVNQITGKGAKAAQADMNQRVTQLESDNQQLQVNFTQWMVQIQEIFNNKSDIAIVTDLEKQMLSRLNEIVAALSLKFMDKSEHQKNFKFLDSQFKILYNLLQKKEEEIKDEDNMFQKKHLCGFSCACCDKDLINLSQKRVEFIPTHKMPHRNPSERIARVGQGFSKILSIMNMEPVFCSQSPISDETRLNSTRNNTTRRTLLSATPTGKDDLHAFERTPFSQKTIQHGSQTLDLQQEHKVRPVTQRLYGRASHKRHQV